MLRGRHKDKREKSKLYGVGKDLKLGGSGSGINEGHVEASWSHPTVAKEQNVIFYGFETLFLHTKLDEGREIPRCGFCW